MRRVDQLITQIRRETENVEYGTTYGIPQEEFVQYLSDAQDQLQGAILRANPDCSWFFSQETYSLTSSTRAYTIPDDCYYTNQLRLVEFKENTSDDYYTPLQRVHQQELSNWSSWPPDSYSLYNNSILVSPRPNTTSGTLRVTYVRKMPKLDLPRATITSYVAATSTLILNNDAFLDASTISAWLPQYFSATQRKDGASLTWNIDASGYDTTTRTLSLTAAPTYEGSYTLSNLPSQMLTLGKNSTCISQLPEDCERYLLSYGAWKIFKRDASSEANDAGNQLQAIEENIIKASFSADSDYQTIPIEF